MVRYFYAWAPLVVVGALVLLSLPWLGLIALFVATLLALAALAALAWATVAAPLAVGHAIARHWSVRHPAPQPSAERRHAWLDWALGWRLGSFEPSAAARSLRHKPDFSTRRTK
jgi:hypothetical protein